MRPETMLGGGAVAALAALLVLGVVAPGAIASPEPATPDPPGDLALREVSIAPGPVSGATATLELDARLTHNGGTSENVTVEFRAVDSASQLVEATRRVTVGNVSETGEVRVRANLSVERSGGYRIETIAYSDGERVDSGRRSVGGVGSLDPDYEDVGIAFETFDDEAASFPAIEYSIGATEGNSVTLDVSAYVTNSGDTPSTDVEMVVVARQVGSGIVADRATVAVGEVRPGRTATPEVDLTVPDEYGYYLDAMLKRDGVVVSTARAGADLSPGTNGTVTVNRSGESGGLRVGDFVGDEESPDAPGGGDRGPDGTETRTQSSGGGGPGFGPVVAVLAVLTLALVARRRQQ